MVSDSKASTGLYDFVAWLETNKKQIIWAAIVLAAAGLAAYAYLWYEDQRDQAADEALLALRTSQSQSEEKPSDPSAFLKVAKEYASTRAGERAWLLGAGAYFQAGNYAEAESQFSQFLKDHAESSLTPQAAYGLAAALEAEGKMDAALTAYQNVTVKYPSSSVVHSAKVAIARIDLAKNQPAAALKIYEELMSLSSSRDSEVPMLREQLLARHPELRTTNAAPAALQPPVGLTDRANPRAPRSTNAISNPNRPAAPAKSQPPSLSPTNKSR